MKVVSAEIRVGAGASAMVNNDSLTKVIRKCNRKRDFQLDQ